MSPLPPKPVLLPSLVVFKPTTINSLPSLVTFLAFNPLLNSNPKSFTFIVSLWLSPAKPAKLTDVFVKTSITEYSCDPFIASVDLGPIRPGAKFCILLL